MENREKSKTRALNGTAFWLALLTLFAGMALQATALAQDLAISVVGADGIPVTGFRWLVEEDAGRPVAPGVPATPGVSPSLTFHTSYMPVVGSGNSTDPTARALDPLKRYYVSVLPDANYTIAGAQIAAGQTAVTVVVNNLPLPTAQISVFVFHDNHPLNNQADLPEESGIPNMTVKLIEAGGTYGASGGEVTQDAFANPIGTTYDTNGNVLVKGNGILKTDANGELVIKNLVQGKYTILVSPPAGSDWQQTSTIEGTKGVDAWVKAGEPPFFQEFGPPGYHVSIGFTHKFNNIPAPGPGVRTSNITGRIVNLRNSRPPEVTFYDGHPLPNCWIGLNDTPLAGGLAHYAQPCNPDSTFTIPSVPAGDYQLVIWDQALDQIFATYVVNVPNTGAEVDLLDIPVFQWFGRLEGSVFYDTDGDGFRDLGEGPLPGQAINLRFRDGSIYQATTTASDGSYELPEVFPFFNWLVSEVDFARFKATGATITVDNGGPADPADPWSFDGKINPQPQAENAGLPYRTETGQVLLEGVQTFLGQTNHIDWGKQRYPAGENGGISGIVHYATTRAEDDPRYAAAENWEPGIPRVQVNLYRDCNNDGIIDRPDCSGLGSNTPGGFTLADVDNWPFGNFPGTEDLDRNGNTTFDLGDAIEYASTDSWDDNLPTGCQGDNMLSVIGVAADQCFDGLRNFNQVRPALFDGGYAFAGPDDPITGQPKGLPPGGYIVEAIAPNGYLHVGNGDKNVAFGDTYTPAPLLLPPVCVGDAAPVPEFLTMFPGANEPNPLYTGPGQMWSKCDRKKVRVAQGTNTAADFFMFTEVPVAGHVTGMILDDLANEFDVNAPTFGEKYSPPWLPVSFRDFTGREIGRTYSDQWGIFNALVPSTYTVNPPFPSGVSPNMITACMNSPTMPDPANPGQFMLDPYFNRQYSQFCYTFQYMPGKTTYLDTPVMRISAFAALQQFPLDCEYPDGTPAIYSVTGRNGSVDVGPWVPATGDRTLTIVSMGNVQVNNPAYDGTNAKLVTRDFGFGGTPGVARLRNSRTNAIVAELTVTPANWTAGAITATVPSGLTGVPNGQYELEIVRSNGLKTVTGVTVTVGGAAPIALAAGQSIQAAIDAAPVGALITLAPGQYEQIPIMYKKVRLQGWGPGSTIINAAKFPTQKLDEWRIKLASLVAGNQFDLLPGQAPAATQPILFSAQEGAGITVLAQATQNALGTNWRLNNVNNHARIDGLTITGGDAGAVFVNGHANWLEISNNRIVGNSGFYGGGIRIGNLLANGDSYTDNQNDNVNIHNNQVIENGSLREAGGGGGISLYTGANNYSVSRNLVCGNFSSGEGGGIAHLGLSNNGVIDHNTIAFNETFNQGLGKSGGGIFIGGLPSLVPTALSDGAGTVTVDKNLIQGNMAGAGDGGGIRAQFVNGADVLNPLTGGTTPLSSWYRLFIFNNMIVDNAAGLAGGGISLQDVTRSLIINNTVANNDGLGTAGEAFPPGSPDLSTAQPGGMVSRAHSAGLLAVFNDNNTPPAVRNGRGRFSKPVTFMNNIFWHNRSFFWSSDPGADPVTFGLQANPADGGYWDLAVLGTPTPMFMTPEFSILTSLTQQGHDYSGNGNLAQDPLFQAQYFNAAPGSTVPGTAPITAPALDEGGNWIDVHFGPLTLDPTAGLPVGNYHLGAGSPASQAGNIDPVGDFVRLRTDYDDGVRPSPALTAPDIGADEVN